MKQARLVGLKAQPPAPERKHARVEGNPAVSQRQQHIIRLYLTAILLLSMMFTVYIWQSTKMVEVKLRIKKRAKQIEMIETNNAVLRAEISKLQSISRIETVAKRDLGMIVPKKVCYLQMPSQYCKK